MFPTVKSPKDWTGYGRTNLYENTLTVMMIMHCQSSRLTLHASSFTLFVLPLVVGVTASCI